MTADCSETARKEVGVGGERHSTEFFFSGKLRPEIQTLILLYNINDRKGNPFLQCSKTFLY